MPDQIGVPEGNNQYPASSTLTYEQQSKAFAAALSIFLNRTAVRGDHWVENPVQTHIDMISVKNGRIEYLNRIAQGRQLTSAERDDLVDNALDVANFAAFIARKYLNWLP